MPQTFPATLTRSSFSDFKREAHAALPTVKSSHLAEALAAAFGHRTYAALQAALAAASQVSASLEQTEATLAFNERLHRFGYPVECYAAFSQLLPAEDIVARIRGLAVAEPVLAETPDLDRCASYGIIVRRKPDGGIFATHPVAGALGPYDTLEAAASAACSAWL